MMSDAKDGEISRIVVKKYDRFSRNMREYLNITNELDNLGISVYSLSEPFNTATKEGRMMRNNLLNFAEFERETIAARVADAYNTKARETGFYQGSNKYYGYKPERRTVNGKTGSVLVPCEKAEVVKIAYEYYQKSDVSLKDIIDYLRENLSELINPSKHFENGRKYMDRGQLSKILCNPLYVRANAEIYSYFASRGYEMIDDVSEYDGIHGLFRHKKSDGSQYIKLGYHEGIIDSETWLAVQNKKSHNIKFHNNGKAKNSWLVGLVKCAYCGYALNINVNWNARHTIKFRYYIDSGAYCVKGCVKNRLKIKPNDVENAVYEAMKDRLEQLVIAKKENKKPDTKTENIKSEIAYIENEIRKLMDKLAEADEVLFDYINQRIKELHTKKTELNNKLSLKFRKHKQIDTKPLTGPMSHWEELSLEEKHQLAVTIIDVIYVSDEKGIDIRFSI